jgi:enoyl-CoA hydratase/carnithine racemase
MLIALAQGKPVPGAVEDETRRHAMEPIGMELTKQLIYRGLHETNIATQVEREDAALLRGFKTDDYVEGSTACWIDKRKPVFKGR